MLGIHHQNYKGHLKTITKLKACNLRSWPWHFLINQTYSCYFIDFIASFMNQESGL